LATGLLAKFGSPQRHVLGAALSVSEAATGFENFCRRWPSSSRRYAYLESSPHRRT
jgi:hypothetical protein